MEEENKKVYCRRCGRLLKGADSKKLEFGPSCYRIYKKERDQAIQLFDINKPQGDVTKDE